MNRLILLGLAAVLVASPVNAYPSPREAPSYQTSPCAPDKHFVFDYTGMAGAAYAAEWETLHCEFFQMTGSHFVIVLANSTEGQSLETYAAGLFNYWGIGDKTRGDGILLLYVKSDNEGYPGLYIGAGKGIVDVLTPSKADSIYGDARDAKEAAKRAGRNEAKATLEGLEEADTEILRLMVYAYEDGDFHAGLTPSQEADIAAFLNGLVKVLGAVIILGASTYGIWWLATWKRREEERVAEEKEAKRLAAKWDADERRRKAAEKRRRDKEAAERATVAGTSPATVCCKRCYTAGRACRHGYEDDALINTWLTYYFVAHAFGYPSHSHSHSSGSSSSYRDSSDHSSSSFGGFGGGGFGGSFGGGGFGGGGGGRF